MPARRLLALFLACLVPLAAACSDDGGDAAATTTSASASSGSGETTTEGDTATTVPQLPFEQGVAKLRASLKSAGGDVCALVMSLGTVNVADPATPAEAKEAVQVVTEYLDAIADAAPDQASTLHQAAKDFASEAEAAGYDVAAISNSKVMNSSDVSAALTKATQRCTTPGT
jgi:hypothetical protein